MKLYAIVVIMAGIGGMILTPLAAAPNLAGDSVSPFGAPATAMPDTATIPAMDDDDLTSGIVMVVHPAIATGVASVSAAAPAKPGAIVITEEDLKKEMADNSTSSSGAGVRQGAAALRPRPASPRGEAAVENIENGELLITYEPIEIEEHSTSVKATVINNSIYTLDYWRIGLNFDKAFNRSVGYSAAAGARLAPKGEAQVTFIVTYSDKVRGKTSVDKHAIIEEVYILDSRGQRINVTSSFKLKER